jgi:hypothetical protein
MIKPHEMERANDEDIITGQGTVGLRSWTWRWLEANMLPR